MPNPLASSAAAPVRKKTGERARRRQLSQMAEVAVRLFAGILRRREQAGGMTSSKNHG